VAENACCKWMAQGQNAAWHVVNCQTYLAGVLINSLIQPERQQCNSDAADKHAAQFIESLAPALSCVRFSAVAINGNTGWLGMCFRPVSLAR
jgi:hypothetical protein